MALLAIFAQPFKKVKFVIHGCSFRRVQVLVRRGIKAQEVVRQSMINGQYPVHRWQRLALRVANRNPTVPCDQGQSEWRNILFA
jgi:hypothetical protein